MRDTSPAIGTVATSDFSVASLLSAIRSRKASIGVIGLGYVGIPLALAGAKAEFSVIGFDIDRPRVAQLNRGESFIKHIANSRLAEIIASGRFEATTDFDRLRDVDAIIICVPTPLTKHREPDLSFVINTTEAIASRLQPGQLVILESTTYPGTTEEVLKPIPEREDPGNLEFATAAIPKVVGGDGPDALRLVEAFYSELVERTVPVSSLATAEAVKLTENIFRSVNIALVNELKLVFGAMGVDIWEVIDAAKTKPFGFMPFYPGPGLGGHCIPINPFYLTWRARQFDLSTRFIELAGEINTAMPRYIIDRVAEGVGKTGSERYNVEPSGAAPLDAKPTLGTRASLTRK